ncbi:MAG: class I SAM-dependent methyltransferase [Candidatus Parcubacteria bacterium]|nr:class I SAM-dependent methyltransferase [Candidatus Parcubacteria bacterium]
MVDIICALCGQKQQVRVLYEATFDGDDFSVKTYSARRLPDKIHYRIMKCESCSLVFSSPIFPAEKLSKFYRKSLCNYRDQIPYLIKTYFKIVEQIKNNLPKNPKVLEVGCGNGFFLKALVDLGFTKNVSGIEPSSKMVLEAEVTIRKKIKINIFKSDIFPKNSFDLILCFHTLDHMFNPNEFVRGAYSMLKKNGYVIVVVHDTEGLSVKLFGEKSAIFDIEHVYLFNKKTLRKIFELNNFKVLKIFNLINNYPLNYWMQMSGFPSVVKKCAKFIFNIFKISKKEISIPAGNIALIAKKNV